MRGIAGNIHENRQINQSPWLNPKSQIQNPKYYWGLEIEIRNPKSQIRNHHRGPPHTTIGLHPHRLRLPIPLGLFPDGAGHPPDHHPLGISATWLSVIN